MNKYVSIDIGGTAITKMQRLYVKDL